MRKRADPDDADVSGSLCARPFPLAIRRLLAIRLDNIGDMVMLSPALRAMRQAMPETEIHLLASPAGGQAAPLLPWINGAFTHRAVWQDISATNEIDVAGQQAFIESLRGRAYDAALIFTSFSQSPYAPAYACYLAGIPLRAGQSREFGGRLLTHWVRPLGDDTHQVDRNLHLLESLGIPAAGRHLELCVPLAEREKADCLLGDVGLDRDEPFIAIVPGASCASRRYEPHRFAEVARRLVRAAGLRILVLGSAREADLVRPIVKERQAAVVSLVGRTTVPMLADVIRRASLIVANDSSAMHLADAFARPAVILFSGTDLEEQWRPRRSPSRLLRRRTPCAPCRRFTCPYQMECLDIRPAAVVRAAMDLLKGQREIGQRLMMGEPR